jgi:hypothetical protein
VLIGIVALWWYFNPDRGKRYVEIDRFTIGDEQILLYADYGWDSAVLGFVKAKESGDTRFFPFYFSVYRGLPPMRLQVFRSQANDAIWVYALWSKDSAPEVLAYHELNSDSYLCTFGSRNSLDAPMPSQMAGGRPNYPLMNKATSTLILDTTYPSGNSPAPSQG